MELLAVIIGALLFGIGYTLGSDRSYVKGYAHALLTMHEQGLITLDLTEVDNDTRN